MEVVAQTLLDIIAQVEPRLHAVSDADAALKPAPGKWSKKEILGHLIDSAGNNQQKFVRILLSSGATDFVGYDQDAWVARQHYQEQNWSDIIQLWAAYNRHLAHIIRHADPSKHDYSIRISGQGPFSLGFIMPDYVEHLKHHLIQILPDAGLTSRFSMTAYA